METRPVNAPLRPWLGLASFTEANAAQFFGREAEVSELVRRLSRKGLTVLFGQSGLGKTSMLQAGVVPRLRDAGFAPVPLRMDYSAESPSCEAQMLAALGWPTDEGLWEQLHRRDREGPAPLLIFDQFEEVFTLGQADEAGRAKAQTFLAELADLVENRVPAALEAKLESDDTLFDRYDLQRADFRLLISLREDYLAHLEPLKSAMPGITQNRMRIAPMTGEQALQAVCGPGGELVSTDTAEAIVRFVSGAKSIEHAEVEPALLSLILRELNEQRIAKGQAQITPDLLAGSHAAILSDFYERSLADQPQGVRHFIEDQLLTDTGYRENVAEERVKQAFGNAGAQADALEQLVNRRLLRVEERLDRRRVELTHDTLCAVVAASRDARHDREQLEASARALAEQQASEQRAVAQATAARTALRRSRVLSAGAFGLAAVAIAASAWAWRTQQATEAARLEAEAARNQAQSLMGYLLEDFYEDLQPVGRTPLVTALGQRLISYYEGLPERLQGQTTEAQRAHAELRTAMTLHLQADLDRAEPLLSSARGRFEALRAGGDASLDTQLGLAQTLAYQARVLDSRFKLHEGWQQALESLALLPAETRGWNPAQRLTAWRVVHAVVILAGATGHFAEGERAALRALALLKQGGADQPPQAAQPWSMRLGAAFVEAASWTLQTMPELRERAAERQAIAEAGLAQANRLLALDPANLPVGNDRAALWRTQADAKADALDLAEAERLTRLAIEERLRLVQQDPRNTRIKNNTAVAQVALARMAWLQGRFGAALEAQSAAIATHQSMPKTGFLMQNLQTVVRDAMSMRIDLGDWAAAESHQRQLREIFEWRLKADANRLSFLRPFVDCLDASYQAELDRARGRLDKIQIERVTRFLQPMDPSLWKGRDATGARTCTSRVLKLVASWYMDQQAWAAAANSLRMGLLQLGSSGTERGRRTEARQKVLLAMAFLRSGQPGQARQELAPALEWIAATRMPGHMDQEFRLLDLGARQLEAELAPPAQAVALRAAVRAELKLLAPEMRRLASTRDWLRWFQLE